MINDPYIEIINKTRSLNLDEALIEQAIDKYLKEGTDKAFFFLIQDKKTPEDDAWKLMEEIKKEFKASYYANALYAGVFMVLFLAFAIILLNLTEGTNFWIYFSTCAFLSCAYVTIRCLIKALNIK